MSTIRRVAVLVETSRAYGRGLLRGVAQYHREQSQWEVYFEPHGLDEPPPTWLRDWKGDGILARIATRRMADAILKMALPTVELRGALYGLGLPFIGVDNQMVARFAFDHLVERGLRQFAFCGLHCGADWRLDERCDHFLDLTQAAGVRCDVFHAWRGESVSKDRDRLEKWVKALPKPVGIVACNDDRGRELLDVCHRASVRVPDQVAVVGVDNDEYLCGFAKPPLSSIDVATQGIGYEAAALLNHMMAGKAVEQQTRLLPPSGVVIRQSSDVLATEDRTVAQAVAFIRTHACERITIGDVIRHVAVSRGTLEPRLKSVVGRTIHEEIQHTRIEKVKSLLRDTDSSLKQIAYRCGFRYTQHLAKVFRKATGETLLKYRKRVSSQRYM